MSRPSSSPRSANVVHRAGGSRANANAQQQQLQRQFLDATRDIPGVRISAGGGGNPGSGPLQIELTGDDSNLLAAAAAQIEREMRAVPGFSNVTTSASLLQPELVIRPRPDRAAELGVTTAAISQATRIATSGDVTNNLAEAEPAGPADSHPRAAERRGAHRTSTRSSCCNVPSRFGPVPLMNVADV